jgi:hypothetical protein
MMYGVINKDLSGKFKPPIEEENVYIITNVTVTPTT